MENRNITFIYIVELEQTEELKQAIEDYRQEFIANDEGDSIHGGSVLDQGINITDWLDMSYNHANDINLPEGWVRASQYCLIDLDSTKIIGLLQLRHKLNQDLLETGGHIGYSISPSERGNGYAKFMLKEALKSARNLGISDILITANEDNIASNAVILSAGGELENTFVEEDGNVVNRYWIKL